jgi:hypothetical protein
VSATLTPFTRSPNIKKVQKVEPPRVGDVMIENNRGTEDRPSPSSERKLKPPRRSPSGSSVTNAKEEESSSSAEPRVSSSWISRRSKRKMLEEETPCTNDLPVLFKFDILPTIHQHQSISVVISKIVSPNIHYLFKHDSKSKFQF